MTTTTPRVTNVEKLQAPEPVTVRDLLLSPIDERHLKTRVQETKNGSIELDYYPCWVLWRCLIERATNGYRWEIASVEQFGEFVCVRGRLVVFDEEGIEQVVENVASERLDSKGAPPIETAASSCFRRCAAGHGLGIAAYLGD